MKRFISLFLVFLAAGIADAEDGTPSRVILLSWDGAPYWVTSHLLAAGRLPNLERMVREGVWSDGLISSSPTKTAPAHAMLWTGQYGHTNGITGNDLLLEPASEYSLLESRSGYFSDALKTEPVWVRAARAGLMTYTFHAMQSYPFERHMEMGGPNHLRMLYGYTQISIPADFLDETNVSTAPAEGWVIPEAKGAAARELKFGVDGEPFWGLLFDDPMDPYQGCDTLGLVHDKGDEIFITRIKPGMDGDFSVPIEVSHQGEDLWFSLRLFELDPSCSRFSLYRSSSQAVEASGENFPGWGEPALEAFAGNGGGALYRSGDLGAPLTAGGEGDAESRFIETLAHVTEQLQRQAGEVLKQSDYRLLILSTPVLDEVTHAFAGYLDPHVPGYDEELARKLWLKLAEAFELQDALLGSVMEQAERDGAHLLLVSDHGMAGTNRRLNVNVALERAGLLALTPERNIDLSRTSALLLPFSDASLAVNTMDRKGGIVPPDDRQAVLNAVRRVLEAVVDPETGARVVAGVYDSSRFGLLQPGGETTGDLFLDLAPGYDLSPATDEDQLIIATPPEGSVIFLPTRRDMLGIFAAWGPRVPSGERWPKVRGIDVVPSILDLLELEKPSELPGRSLIPIVPIVPSHRSSDVSHSAALVGFYLNQQIQSSVGPSVLGGRKDCGQEGLIITII